jgi:hypothetical protein
MPQSTSGAFSPKASLAAEAGPAAQAGLVVVVVLPVTAVLAAAAVVDPTAKTASPPRASPEAGGVAEVVVEPGSCSAP